MIWSANRYQELPHMSLKRVGILTGGGGIALASTHSSGQSPDQRSSPMRLRSLVSNRASKV